MKKLNLFLLAILAITISFTSCGDDDDNTTPGTSDPLVGQAKLDSAFATALNVEIDPGFGATNIIPTASEATADVLDASTIDAFFTATNYKGAVDPSGTAWYAGWSFYERLVGGNTTDIDRSAMMTGTSIQVTENITTNTTWETGNTYVLTKLIFVDGAELTIQPGTIIKGVEGVIDGNGNVTTEPGALVVATTGTINANGSATQPIIFTFDGDDLDGTVAASESSKWGGVIILGEAGLNSSPGTSQIEGIDSGNALGSYGGNNDADNSGSFRYVSIRHGGFDIGAGNEINGLSLGGVGSGTTIEFVEVIGNKDDGFEWFGGTVNGKWLISAFCGDDALDYDEGYRGMNQWVIVHQSATAGDRGGEHDGGTDPENATPFATPHFVNVTSVGNPDNRAITFRDNAGGFYINSIFTGYGRGIDVEAFSDGSQSSFVQFENGNLAIRNCIFNVGGDAYVINEQ